MPRSPSPAEPRVAGAGAVRRGCHTRVNADAIIAALLLAVLLQDYRSGTLTVKDLETAALSVFLYCPMIGAAAEIDNQLNRGRNMDMRTAQEDCRFIA